MSPYFPMYINLENKTIVVIGGGNIAARRISVLLDFQCKIHVIAPVIHKDLKKLKEDGLITVAYRTYIEGDCKGAFFVLAATDVRDVNHQIALECRREHIIVNVCDCKEACDFYFPAVIKKDNIVIGVTASGKDHKQAKVIAERIRSDMDNITSSAQES